jgi:hypothetical protein
MITAKLAIQCTAPDGTRGDFLYEGDIRNKEKLTLHSPVLPSLVDMFLWCDENGWTEHMFERGDMVFRRVPQEV